MDTMVVHHFVDPDLRGWDILWKRGVDRIRDALILKEGGRGVEAPAAHFHLYFLVPKKKKKDFKSSLNLYFHPLIKEFFWFA